MPTSDEVLCTLPPYLPKGPSWHLPPGSAEAHIDRQYRWGPGYHLPRHLANCLRSMPHPSDHTSCVGLWGALHGSLRGRSLAEDPRASHCCLPAAG
jgi:hypothetical protein